jgi:hypothetical protein
MKYNMLTLLAGFGLQTCGTANITAIEAAAKAGVPRFVFISAQIPNVPGIGRTFAPLHFTQLEQLQSCCL